MSEINRELQKQNGDLGKVMRKLFPDGPKISEDEADKLREEAEATARRDIGTRTHQGVGG